MMKMIDKRDRAALFRTRLLRALSDIGLSQAALARHIGVDRSTISQALGSSMPRLPNAQTVGACAQALGVSADWLLGLSDRPERADAVSTPRLDMTEASRALIDEQIIAWHEEAAGYKIRHVPASLPDMLKTSDMLEWEYTPKQGHSPESAMAVAQDRLALLKTSQSDYEIALPIFQLESFALGQTYYQSLPKHIRLAEIEHLIDLSTTLYPRLRIYLYDAGKLYSAPVTVFGPLLAVIYTGGHYLMFRDRERIEILTRHFDELVRNAQQTARDLPDWLEKLRSRIT